MQAGFVMQIKRTEISNQTIFICDKQRMQGQNRFHPCMCCIFRHFSCACVAYYRLETGLKHRYRYHPLQSR